MVVFSIFFGQMAGMPTDGVPYPIFSYAGLLPWGLFSKALQDAGRSLVVNRQMITKVYFPRIILPLASTMAGLVDFVIAFVVLLGMMLFYRIAPTADIWTLPLFLLLALLTAFGAGLWLAALNVLYRDIAYVLPFLTQFWLFITPVIYPTNLVSEKWKFLYALNPMTGVVEGFRWALLGTRATPPTELLLPSLVTAALLVITGLIYFRRTERLFADMV
jgi:lipopolysaccharide transport system permease protein